MLHEDYRERVADGDDSDDLAFHEDSCSECSAWTERLREIVALAPWLAAVPPRDLAPEVVRRSVSPPLWRRPAIIVSVAAAAVLLVGTLVVSSGDSRDRDQLAAIAAEMEASGSFRFVVQAETRVDLALPEAPDNLPPLTPLSFLTPTCTADQPATTQPEVTIVDIIALVERTLATDPCSALAHIDEEFAPQVIASYNTVATSAQTASVQVAAARAIRPTSSAQRASIDAFVSRRELEIAQLDAIAQGISAQADLVSGPLAAVALAANQGEQPGIHATDAADQLRALSAIVDSAATASIDMHDTTVTWHQVATGTWTPAKVTAAGTNEVDGTAVAFQSITTDALALASTLLGDPTILLRVLESAPASDRSGAVAWNVPASVLGDGTWNASAVLDAGRLDRLTLTVCQTIITLIPER